MKMDRQYSWKRTEEMEIDLADLLRRLCMQWRRMAVCALAAAVVLGGCGWLKEYGFSDKSGSDLKKKSMLTEMEEQGVEDAVRLEHEIRGLEEYMDASVLMRLDPYHKHRYIMLYRIDHAKRQELPVIVESYLNFTVNGGAADALMRFESGKTMEQSSLAELISAYQKTYHSPYQIMADGSSEDNMLSEELFYVDITGINDSAAESMALDIQKVLEEYSGRVKKIAGNHTLTLVSNVKNIMADSGLQSQQHDKKEALSSSRKALKSMKDAFTKEQMAAYQEAVGEENVREESKEVIVKERFGFGVKLAFAGFLGGVFLYCCIYSCRYILLDTVKNSEEMQRLYMFPHYGEIVLENGNKENDGKVTGEKQNVNAYGKSQVLNRIKITCKKHGITRLYAVSDFTLYAQEKECLENIAKQLNAWDIEMLVAENVIADTAVWDELTETGNVLMVCRMGITTHRMIDQAMSFYLENGIAVTGAASFSQKRNNRNWL